MITKELKVAIYARVSTDQQAQGGTILSQVEELRRRVQEDGVFLEESFCFFDDGYSGSNLIRPGLERLRDTAAAGALDRLYVHSPDRLARNYAHQVLLVEELTSCGVELTFLNHAIGETPEQQLLLQVQGVIAEYERAKILERCRRGTLAAARRGSVSVLRAAPYGYRYITVGAGGGVSEYQIVLEEARIVRQIFEWVGRDRLSIYKVTQQLQRDGIPTAKGKTIWNRSTIWDILKNPAYKGTAAFGRRRGGERRERLSPWRGRPAQPRCPHSTYSVPESEWIYIPVPALVSEELFKTVQEQLAENRKRIRERGVGAKYLLRGLMVCEECGYAMHGHATTRKTRRGEKRRHTYYQCTGREAHRFGGQRICWSKPLRADLVEQSVWKDVRALLSEPARLTEEFQRRLDGNREDIGADAVKEIEQQIQRLKKAIGR
jgi:site-specific DNA recombinase